MIFKKKKKMLLRSKRDITMKNKDLMFKNVPPLLKISLQTVGNVIFKSKKKKKNTNKIQRKQVHKNNISNLVSNFEMIKRKSVYILYITLFIIH